MNAPGKNVLLVDDHDFVRRAMKRLLEADSTLVVRGEAASFEEARRLLKRRPFDLVVMDLVIPGEDGLGFIRAARKNFPKLGILVVSLHKESLFAELAIRAGANGFLMKNDASERLVEAAQTVLSHQTYISPWMQQILLNRLRESGRALSKRQLQSRASRPHRNSTRSSTR